MPSRLPATPTGLARLIPLVRRWWWRIWLLLFALFLVYFMLYPELFSMDYMRERMKAYGENVWWIYVALSMIRGVFLLPSTPFILLGTALFPDALLWVSVFSMFAILCSATFLYYLSDSMGIAALLERKYPGQLEKAKHHLNSPKGLLWMVLWSFFPVVPTDLMCYVARLVGIRFGWMLLGVFLGELPLIWLCTYGVNEL